MGFQHFNQNHDLNYVSTRWRYGFVKNGGREMPAACYTLDVLPRGQFFYSSKVSGLACPQMK